LFNSFTQYSLIIYKSHLAVSRGLQESPVNRGYQGMKILGAIF